MKKLKCSLLEKTKFFVWPSWISEVGCMAHRQKMLRTPDLELEAHCIKLNRDQQVRILSELPIM